MSIFAWRRVALVLVVGVAAWGCELTPTGPDDLTDVEVDELLEQAIQALEDALFVALNIGSVAELDDVSFQEAHDLFVLALQAAPADQTAAFGVAVTAIFLVIEDEQVRSLAEDWEAWLEAEREENDGFAASALLPLPDLVRQRRPTLPLDLSGAEIERIALAGLGAPRAMDVVAMSHGSPPSLSRHQTVLDQSVRPALQVAQQALSLVTDPSFVFIVTERMQGESPEDATPLKLDYTEVLVLRAGLDVALAAIGVATAYSLEGDPFSPEGFVAAMTPGSSFLTLTPDGAAKLADALERLLAAVGTLEDALDNLEAETDDQTDHIIKYDPTGTGDGVTPEDIEEARGVLAEIEAALSGPTTITIDEGGPDETTLTVDVREFFIDPIGDFKALLPPYEVFTTTEGESTGVAFRWQALNLDEWIVPDPTFSGILPGMETTQDLIDALDLDELFFDLSLAGGWYVLISIDGTDCRESYVAGGGGCTVGEEQFHDGWLDLGGRNGTAEAWFDAWGTTFVSASGPYTVSEEGEGSYSVAMDLVDDAGGSFSLTGWLLDRPGYELFDDFFRTRGGSSITLSYLGAEWVFEKQH